MNYSIIRGNLNTVLQIFTTHDEEEANKQYQEWATLISDNGDNISLKINDKIIRSWTFMNGQDTKRMVD